MRRSIAVAILGTAAFSLTLAGCNKSAGGATDADSVKQTIKADEAKWNKDFKAKDTEGLAGHYADDAFFVASGTTAEGSTPIRQVFADASTDPAFNVQFSSDKIDVSSLGIQGFDQLVVSAFDPSTHESTITFSQGNDVVVHSQVALTPDDFLFA